MFEWIFDIEFWKNAGIVGGTILTFMTIAVGLWKLFERFAANELKIAKKKLKEANQDIKQLRSENIMLSAKIQALEPPESLELSVTQEKILWIIYEHHEEQKISDMIEKSFLQGICKELSLHDRFSHNLNALYNVNLVGQTSDQVWITEDGINYVVENDLDKKFRSEAEKKIKKSS